MSDLHPGLAPLHLLVGDWRGTGRGEYPTIDPFDYREEVTFSNPPGKPFLAYRQMTWSAGDDQPLHVESGYLRPGERGSWEWVMAQPSGFVEIYAGRLTGRTLTLDTTTLARTPTAKKVTHLRRILTLGETELAYEVEMEAVDHPLQRHLTGQLQRVVKY